MRLQCPNCDAEYEVDASAIPQEGRDVQCSNCGHGWYQGHPDYEPDYELDSALFEPPPPLEQFPPSQAAFPRHEIDPSAMQILREEAAREEAMRAADQKAQAAIDTLASPTENTIASAKPAHSPNSKPAAQQQPQPSDRGLDEDLEALRTQELPMPRITARVTRRRLARLRGESEDTTPPQPDSDAPAPGYAETAPPKSYEWASYGPEDDGADAHQADDLNDLRAQLGAGANSAGSGRSAGMYTTLFVAILAIALYVMAPTLAARVPTLASPLAAYVEIINALRDGVQIALAGAIAYVTSFMQSLRG